MEGNTLIATVYDVTFVAPTVHEGNFVWEGDKEDAEEAFIGYLEETFPEGSFKILELKISEDQEMELPLQIEKSKLN